MILMVMVPNSRARTVQSQHSLTLTVGQHVTRLSKLPLPWEKHSLAGA
jgi:hypothetical protein